MNVIDFLKDNVTKFPSKTAIIDERQALTFQQLYDRVKEFSASLGFVNKKNVSLVSENSIS